MGRMEGSHQNRIPCVIAVCSEIAFGILLLRPLKTSFILAPAVVILLGVLLRRADAQNGSESSEDKRFMPWIHAGLISLLLGVIFAAVWMRTKRIVSVRFVDWKQAGLILTIAVAAGLCSVPLVRKILQFFSRSRKKRHRIVRAVESGRKAQPKRQDAPVSACGGACNDLLPVFAAVSAQYLGRCQLLFHSRKVHAVRQSSVP